MHITDFHKLLKFNLLGVIIRAKLISLAKICGHSVVPDSSMGVIWPQKATTPVFHLLTKTSFPLNLWCLYSATNAKI